MGWLSNPSEPLETVAGQRFRSRRQSRHLGSEELRDVGPAADTTAPEDPGRLSNPGRRPVQRRLCESEVDTLVAGYQAGRSLRQLATELRIHPRTVAAHLEQRGVLRRVNQRKMTAADVLAAGRRYDAGDSLAALAREFSVDAETVKHELRRAGVVIRPRRARAHGRDRA